MCILFGVGGIPPCQARPFIFISLFEVAGPDISSVQKNYEFDHYIFSIFMEVNGKNSTEPEHKDEFEENYMPVYVKTISGKTIRIKCDKMQKADTVSKKIEMRTAIFRGITYLTHQGKMLKNKNTKRKTTLRLNP